MSENLISVNNVSVNFDYQENFIAMPIQSNKNRPERDRITAINKLFFNYNLHNIDQPNVLVQPQLNPFQYYHFYNYHKD